MPSFELSYFPVHGRAGHIRLLLIDNGVDFKDTIVTADQWANFKPKTVFGQLPMLIVDGKTELAQSGTIFRYIGAHLKLLGGDDLERAQIEMWCDACEDIMSNITKILYTDYEKGFAPFMESVPDKLRVIEKKLSNGDNLLGKASLADYQLFYVLFFLNAMKAGSFDKLPKCSAFFQKFGRRPNIRAYFDKPEVKKMIFTGSGHL